MQGVVGGVVNGVMNCVCSLRTDRSFRLRPALRLSIQAAYLMPSDMPLTQAPLGSSPVAGHGLDALDANGTNMDHERCPIVGERPGPAEHVDATDETGRTISGIVSGIATTRPHARR